MDPRTAQLHAALEALPAETITATIRNPRSQAERTFVGPTLVDYAVAAGLVSARAVQDVAPSAYFMVAAADGARVAVSLAEAQRPEERVILATLRDGVPLESGVRLVVPDFPGLGGRSLGGVAAVSFHDVGSAPRVTATASRHVTLRGLIDRPGAVDLDVPPAGGVVAVETPEVEGHGPEPVAPRRYAGASLYGLLDAAGIRFDPAVHEDFLRKIVVVTAADGYPVVIAGGEIEPRFRAASIVLATQRDGAPLADEGPVRLVVPTDTGPGRWARGVASVELRDG